MIISVSGTVPKAQIVSSTCSLNPKRKKSSQDSFFDDYFGDMIITKVEKSLVVIERFQEELKWTHPLAASSAKVLEWWKMDEKQFPILSNAVTQILCTPATSTQSERAFSKAGILISYRRALLKVSILQIKFFS